jgi:protein gp37
MNRTKIEWCDTTLNPVVGCTFNCIYCYARRLNDRFSYIEDWNKPQFFPGRLKQLESKKPKNIFMNSMSDVADWSHDILNVVGLAMNQNPQHNYLFLTKRPDKANLFRALNLSNEWIGATITSDTEIGRIHELINLRCINSNNKVFISFEPIQNDPFKWNGIKVTEEDIKNINWFIIGAETGNRKDKITPKKEWIEPILILADHFNIPVFMKDSMIPIVGEYYMRRELPKELIHK